MSETGLLPVEQKTVTFYDDELTAVRTDNGQIYVSVRHMCDALGVTQRGQVLRIKRSEILSEGYEGGIKMITPGGRQAVGMLRVDLIPLWLSGISTNSVKEAVRGKLKQFQREAAKVLWEAFQDRRLVADPSFDDLLSTDSDAVQAYKMALAVVKLARNQVILESQLQAHSDTLVQYGNRLEELEAAIAQPDSMVTQEQASQISQAVKAIAIELGKQTKRNEFGGVYGELYRKFGITSYKMLPAKKFETAMTWMNEWHGSLTGDEPF